MYAGVCLRSLAWMPLLPLSHALGHEIARDDPDAVAAAIAREIGDGTLVLDSLQAADPDTLDVVARLAGVIALGVAHRTPVARQLDSLLERAGFAIIALAPLEAEEATDLATLHRPRMRRARIEAVVERAGGLPGVLVELAVEADDPTRRRGGRTLAGRAGAPRPAPARAARGGRARAHGARPRRRTARSPAAPLPPRRAVEPATRPAFAALGDPRAVERAEEAWRAARGRGSGEAAARVALGEALFVGGDPSCLAHFEAVVRSLAEIDAEVVYEAAYGLVAGRYAFGDPGSARELASEMASRARVGRDRRFEAIFRLTRAHLDLRVDGAYEAMIAEAHRVLAEAEGTPAGFQAILDMATAHAELGQDAQAVAACKLAARSAVGGPLVAMLAHSIGEIELAAGRPAAALVAAREAASAATTGLIAADLARLTAGWAHLDLGVGGPVSPLREDALPGTRRRGPGERGARAARLGRRSRRSRLVPARGPTLGGLLARSRAALPARRGPRRDRTGQARGGPRAHRVGAPQGARARARPARGASRARHAARRRAQPGHARAALAG